jgi:SAM-dependent methyltransferase
MYEDHVRYLACPVCGGDLSIRDAARGDDDRVQTGLLVCHPCRKTFPILQGVPRFVPAENYAASFGWQWNRHRQTQYDSHTGTKISETRFFEETRWPRNLQGRTVLEVGSGAGRFTEQALKTGALVVSLDYSSAVDANYASHGIDRNVLIVQGDIYAMPFKGFSFDKVFCFGVLQHTPAVKEAFLSLTKFLKAGGNLAIDVYAVNWKLFFKSYYLWRPLTRRMPHEHLYALIRQYVRVMWPLVSLIGRLPGGRLINRSLFSIADYRGKVPLSDDLLKEWAILDTFDTFSPRYDKPQFLSTVRRWFVEAGLTDIDVRFGYNGIEGRGTRPLSHAQAGSLTREDAVDR